MACRCPWTRPASVHLHQCPGAQQPGGHPSPPSSHWQVAACTRSLRGGLGAFGRAATVAAVPGPWCEPWPGTSGPLVMWAPARCRASGGRGGLVTWARTAARGDLGLRLLGLLASLDSPSRYIPGPRHLQALPAVLLGRAPAPQELGAHLLMRFMLRDQGFSMLSLCRVGDRLCAVWFLDLAVSADPEAPGSREAREGRAQTVASPGEQHGEARRAFRGSWQQSAQRPPQGTEKGTDGRSLACVGRDWGAGVLTPAVGGRGPGLALQLLPGPCCRLCLPSLSRSLGGAAAGSWDGSPAEDGVGLTWTGLFCRLVSVWPGRPPERALQCACPAGRGECQVLDPPRH